MNTGVYIISIILTLEYWWVGINRGEVLLLDLASSLSLTTALFSDIANDALITKSWNWKYTADRIL